MMLAITTFAVPVCTAFVFREKTMNWVKKIVLRSVIRDLEYELEEINRRIRDRSAVLESPYRRRAELETRLQAARTRYTQLAEDAAAGGAP